MSDEDVVVAVSLTRSNIVDLIRVEALGVNITNNDIQAIRDSVWQAVLNNYSTNGSAGHKLNKVATKTQDIALR
jgi:hypothetical protein